MKISIFNSSKNIWNDYIKKNNLNYRSLYEWGEYKKSLGWKILRIVITNSDKKYYLQISYKKKFFVGAFYIPDIKLQKIDKIRLLIKFLKINTNSIFVYIRTDDQTEISKTKYKINCFKRPLYRVNNSLSGILDLENYILGFGLSKNYKKYLKKSSQFNNKIVVTNEPNPSDMLDITNKMNEYKKMKVHSFKDYDLLNKNLKKFIKFVVLYDENKKPISYRGALIINEYAWDISAASNFIGRKKYCGFLTLDILCKSLYKMGVKSYNLGAINPKIPGVADFKLSTGVNKYHYIGDYEYSNFFIIRYLINLFIYFTLSKKVRASIPYLAKYNF